MFLNPHWPMWYLAGLVPVAAAHAAAQPAAGPAVLGAGRASAWSAALRRRLLDLNRAMGLLPFFTARPV